MRILKKEGLWEKLIILCQWTMIVTNLITVKIKPTIIITCPESIRQFLTPWCTRTCPPCSAPCNPSWCPPPSQPWSSVPSDHTWDISTHPSILARSKNRVFIKFSLKSLTFKLTWFRLNSDLPDPQLTFTWPGPGPELDNCQSPNLGSIANT